MYQFLAAFHASLSAPLWMSLGRLIYLDFLQTFWEWLLSPHLMYHYQRLVTVLTSFSALWISHVLTILTCVLYHVKYLLSWVFVSIAFCTSTLYATLSTSSLVMLLAFLIIVSSFITSAVIIYSIYKLFFQSPLWSLYLHSFAFILKLPIHSNSTFIFMSAKFTIL